MNPALNALILSAVLLAPFALVATLVSWAHRGGIPRWHTDHFRFAPPMAGRRFEDDADLRRTEHDMDAVRTRFEQHPAWPVSGARDERR